MPDYSGTPLVKKLGLKEGFQVAFLEAPHDFQKTLAPLPDAVCITNSLDDAAQTPELFDLILLFVTCEEALATRFPGMANQITQAGSLWIAWPKKSSGVTTDLSFADVQAIGLNAGLVDNKICAIDETWTALRFVVRTKDRNLSRE